MFVSVIFLVDRHSFAFDELSLPSYSRAKYM
jgi:hypothetical protein